MAKSDTFFLRTTLTTSGTAYVSDDIDISAYTNPSEGRVLVVDRAWVNISSDDNGPVQPGDVLGAAGTRSVGIQATSEKQTSLVQLDNNSVFLKMAYYASNAAVNVFSMIDETSSMNPYETEGGFIIPTDAISCGLDCGSAWTNEIEIGFCFEVHTEKLSLRRIQELLVSLTAN
jgi:hypothetical protein